jgi:4-hydroxybenzoate polyprenyltransferase
MPHSPQAHAYLRAARPHFIVAYLVFFAGGLVLGRVEGQAVSTGYAVTSAAILVVAAVAVHFRDEAYDWVHGYDREHGGAGVVRDGTLGHITLSRAGAALAAAAALGITVLCVLQPLTLAAGIPGVAMILFHNHLTERVAYGHEMVTALSYGTAVMWAYLSQGWTPTASFVLFSLFAFLVALAFVPYQARGAFADDKKNGKKPRPGTLGIDTVGLVSIAVGLVSLVVLYGALLALP